MKRTITLITLLALAAFAASAERFAPATGSLVKVEGTSTLHAWTMQGSTIAGRIDAATPDQWTGDANVTVTIPVTSIRSEHAKMDKLMAEALKARQHPEIRYELVQAMPNGDAEAFLVKTKGKLTIAGVTREVAIDVQGKRNADGRYTLTGTAPIKMTAFGIKPPTAMLNTIKTGDDVTVTFRWIVEKTN
jgi:polyisoprenoid-binding protein YceI